MRATFGNINISGVMGVVPSQVKYFVDELDNYSHSKENCLKLKAVMGYDQHRIAENGVTTSDLACFGLEKLFSSGKVDPSSIDAIFFVSQTPDYVLPPTSAYIHGKFKFNNDVYCVDINDGCCGFIKGLYEASALLTVSSAKRAIIICGDVLSPLVSINDRNSYPLLGDAVTITLLDKTESDSPLTVEIHYDGSGYNKLIVPAGGARLPSSEATGHKVADEEGNKRSLDHLVMQGREVFAFTQTVVPDFLQKFMESLDLEAVDVGLFLLHQANSFILDRLRCKLGVSKEKVPDFVVRKYGNSSSATIPMTIASSEIVTNGIKVIACGFGVGLSWGAASFDLKNLDFCEVIDF